jgi:hypothetical protein
MKQTATMTHTKPGRLAAVMHDLRDVTHTDPHGRRSLPISDWTISSRSSRR